MRLCDKELSQRWPQLATPFGWKPKGVFNAPTAPIPRGGVPHCPVHSFAQGRALQALAGPDRLRACQGNRRPGTGQRRGARVLRVQVLPSLDDHVGTMTTALTRQELYDLVWSEPMLKVAARYEVSSSYMARVCTLLNVPRPERGYWAKLAVGRAPPRPPLPDPLPGDPVTWTRDGSTPTLKVAPRLPTQLEGAPKERRKPRLSVGSGPRQC